MAAAGAWASLASSGLAAGQDGGTPAGYVGASACAGCHAATFATWKRSHHALAMQPATAATVLGDFSGAHVGQTGAATTFSRADGGFRIEAEGRDSRTHDYPVAYTFGVYPLQQYLIRFPDGRLQVFGVAWDSRAAKQGGQRWYHLYEPPPLPGDALHWTGREQSWNLQCAACHTTGLRKGFDLAADAYDTRFSETGVGCEACHGPGSRHVAWARARASGEPARDDPRKGLVAWLQASDRGVWSLNEQTGIAHRTKPAASTAILDSCGGCHARRSLLTEHSTAATPFLDANRPALLEPGLYHADGQIDGEVFEWGSFVQSRMFRAGVTCTNCHDPHAGGRIAEGNALCAQCHMPQKFDVAEHHHHEPGSAGAQCANCHMPGKTYMGVDARRDHSFRVPRPDLTASIGVPNTCGACHADKPPEWAAQAVAAWFPNGRQTQPHYGIALHAGRTGRPDAETQLDALILDRTAPGIARASALALLAPYATAASGHAIVDAISDPDALVRMAASRAVSAATPHDVTEAIAALLSDPVRAVRIEAARALAGTDQGTMRDAQRIAFQAAYRELVDAELTDADRPSAHLNLGLLDARQGQITEAETEYRTALRLDPKFVPALVNLADLDRMRGMDPQAAELLRAAIAAEPANAGTHHALGLLLVRQHEYAAALDQLHQAASLAPEDARYAYVYAVALNSTGDAAQARAVLERAHALHPADRDVLAALVSISHAAGDLAGALRHAQELSMLDPSDDAARQMVRALARMQSR